MIDDRTVVMRHAGIPLTHPLRLPSPGISSLTPHINQTHTVPYYVLCCAFLMDMKSFCLVYECFVFVIM